MLNQRDYIWKIVGSEGDHSGKFEKVFDSRLGVIWYLIWNYTLPTRFTIYRAKKPYNLAEPSKRLSAFQRVQLAQQKAEDDYCAEDAFVARLAGEEADRPIKAGGTD